MIYWSLEEMAMKIGKKHLIRFLAVLLVAGLLVFVVLFSDGTRGREPAPTATQSPTATEPAATATPTATSRPTPTISPSPTATNTPSPTPTEPVLPFTDIENINFENYAGRMNEIRMPNGTLTMGDFGYYTFKDAYGAEHTYRMADYVEIPGEDNLAEGYWFFMGALETPNYIYAQYDYFGKKEHTVFIRVSRTGRYGLMLAYMPYDEFDNYRCFTASNEYIFYVAEAEGGYEILEAGPGGEKPRRLAFFEAGEKPEGLWCMEGELIFLLKREEGEALAAINLTTEKQRIISESCECADYLYIKGTYAITGVQEGKLCVTDITDGSDASILLPEMHDIYYGEPVGAGEYIYLQYFSWQEKSKTEALEIDLKEGAVKQSLLLDQELGYLCGSDGQVIFAERDGGYVSYNIP